MGHAGGRAGGKPIVINRDDLRIESEPAAADVEFLDDRLYDYNVEQTGYNDGQRLAIFVRDAQQTIRAGLDGWTWGGSGEIRSLWVDAATRCSPCSTITRVAISSICSTNV
jgi:hypothetical protein